MINKNKKMYEEYKNYNKELNYPNKDKNIHNIYENFFKILNEKRILQKEEAREIFLKSIANRGYLNLLKKKKN